MLNPVLFYDCAFLFYAFCYWCFAKCLHIPILENKVWNTFCVRQDTGKPKLELVDQFEENVKENMNAHNVAAFVTAYTG